jgi:hypothetical protein
MVSSAHGRVFPQPAQLIEQRCARSCLRRADVRGEQRGQPSRVAARHAAFGCNPEPVWELLDFIAGTDATMSPAGAVDLLVQPARIGLAFRPLGLGDDPAFAAPRATRFFSDPGPRCTYPV